MTYCPGKLDQVSVSTNSERGVPCVHTEPQILRLQHQPDLGPQDRGGEGGGRWGVRVPGGGQGEGDQDHHPHPQGGGERKISDRRESSERRAGDVIR